MLTHVSLQIKLLACCYLLRLNENRFSSSYILEICTLIACKIYAIFCCHCAQPAVIEFDGLWFVFQMWAISMNYFVDIPYELLLSCVKNINLTVDRLVTL